MADQPRKKLIEVALPLEAINKASAREKSIRHGHPSTLHLWWARRPLAAARAVIFAQMVDDPSSCPDLFPTDKKQEKERQRLFRIIENLVLWENTTNETVLQQARDEIWQSWRRACAENADHPRAKELFDRHKLPAFHDPFAGGGALPLEAQRLGLESYASDLNPVAVLINKAMIEIPPKFAGKPPVNPEANPHARHSGESRNPYLTQKLDPGFRRGDELFTREWKGAQGLAEDVRYYGQWMRDEAEKRIGHLYPKVEVTAEMATERPDLKPLVGRKLTVIAWLWARTVKSPNPAFAQVDVPLASTFMLSTKVGKEAYVEPVIEGGGYRFTVKVGKPKDAEAAKNGTSAGKRAGFRCVMSGTPLPYNYIRDEGKAGRMGARPMAIVAEGERGRIYLPPMPETEVVACEAKPQWRPETPLYGKCRVNVSNYGLDNYGDLFTPRQLVALTTFSDLVQEARERVKRDALAAGMRDNAPARHSGESRNPEPGQPLDPGFRRGDEDGGRCLATGGTGATAYADAVAVYLAFAISKLADRGSTICTWFTERDSTRNTFARQGIPMTWDYAELNTLLGGTGSFVGAVGWTAESIERVAAGYGSTFGASNQVDATSQSVSAGKLVSTDPPYYDNIGYADLSDFFYVWLRRSLKSVFPDLFSTLAVPKAEELVATPYRHGSKEKAETFFLDGMTQAMHRLAEQAHPAFPITIYYAFKQAESDGADGTASTGWDTFLDAVIRAGFAISGTWPMRTELSNRMIGSGANALASSIVLVCRPRVAKAPTATRREFITALKAELPMALAHLQRGNIAPVDLAQAAIGPGMGVYTRYARVLDAEGKTLSVREALALINQTLDEALAEQEGDFDADSRWALAWFEQSGFAEGEYGVAETLSKAKNTSVAGMVEAGILASSRGKVRLLKPDELPADWPACRAKHGAGRDPGTDLRLTAWEMVHQLIRSLEAGGEGAAAALVAKLGAKAEVARELAYRLYTVCERKKRAAEALAYNGLVQSWPEIARLAREGGKPQIEQGGLFA
jgi:putative DNA methylase